MNLWLIPASDQPSRENLPKTLAEPISTSRAQQAGTTGDRFAWGARATSEMNVNKFNRMAPGDWCIFYTQSRGGGDKKYRWLAEITRTTRSREVSKALWDTPDFELVYFLKDVEEIDLATEALSEGFSEFRPDYFEEAPKGFTSVDPDVVEGMVGKYGSIRAWLNQLINIKEATVEAFSLSSTQLDMLWTRFRQRVPGFIDFPRPGEAFVANETAYKRRLLAKF